MLIIWDNGPDFIVCDFWVRECLYLLNTAAQLPLNKLTHKLHPYCSLLLSPPRRFILHWVSHANRWGEATKASANPFWNYGGEQIKKLQLIIWALIRRPSWSNPLTQPLQLIILWPWMRGPSLCLCCCFAVFKDIKCLYMQVQKHLHLCGIT